MKKFASLSFIFCLLLITSCEKGVPASFWRDFHTNSIVVNKNDRGSYGGYAVLHWKAKQNKPFSKREILAYAKQNGWKLTNIYTADSATVSKWKSNGTQIFPLSFRGFSPKEMNNSWYANFPRLVKGPLKIYAFKTGWILIDPDTNKKTEQNGFVVIGSDEQQMSVYHLWGE